MTLDHLVDVVARKRACSDDEGRACYDYYFCRLKQRYVEKHGSIEESYFCQNLAGGAVLTKEAVKDPRGWAALRCKLGGHPEEELRIHIRYPTESVLAVTPEFAGALWRCMALSKRATQLLRTENSKAIHKSMYSLAVYLLSVLDTVGPVRPNGTGEEGDRKERIATAIREAQDRLVEAGRQFRASAQWAGRYAFAKGMGIGIVGLGLAELIIYRLAAIRSLELRTFLSVVAAGGVGATVSVMTRMSSNRFHLDQLAEHKALWVIGGFRPMIGAFMAAAIFLIVHGGMLDLLPGAVRSGGASKQFFFFTALGFIAGFSERFAKGVISAVEGSGGQDEGDSSGGSRGRARGPQPARQ